MIIEKVTRTVYFTQGWRHRGSSAINYGTVPGSDGRDQFKFWDFPHGKALRPNVIALTHNAVPVNSLGNVALGNMPREQVANKLSRGRNLGYVSTSQNKRLN